MSTMRKFVQFPHENFKGKIDCVIWYDLFIWLIQCTETKHLLPITYDIGEPVEKETCLALNGTFFSCLFFYFGFFFVCANLVVGEEKMWNNYLQKRDLFAAPCRGLFLEWFIFFLWFKIVLIFKSEMALVFWAKAFFESFHKVSN
jgi:hypothetical protein